MRNTPYNIHAGWLAKTRHVVSPNRSPRPLGSRPELLVIHNISLPPGCFTGDCVEQLFTNRLDWDAHPYFQTIRGAEVSAHLLIRRAGERIQFVSFDERAWHAGVSQWCGRDNCNDFSIGIELEGSDDEEFSEEQYDQLCAVTHSLMLRYPAITADAIVGHSDIAPERKTDPGPHFDWDRYLGQLRDHTGQR